MVPEQIYYSRFLVNESPFCVWEWDLPTRNREFVQNLDPEYFSYLARSLYPDLSDAEVGKRAAVVIRTTYGHALETFFALLFAAFQAPDCVPGWLAKYQIKDLRSLCKKVTYGRPFKSRLKLEKPTWEGVAAAVFGVPLISEHERVTRNFGKLWRHLAQDFVNESQIDEYNSVKHGLRLRAGGFTIQMGWQREEGVPPDPAAMTFGGGSKYGASFLIPKNIGKSKVHFRVRKVSSNWVPENHFHGIELLSKSLVCVRSRILLAAGVPRSEVQFPAPDNDDYFRYPWRLSSGFSTLEMDLPVDPEHIREFSADEIVEVYDDEEPSGEDTIA